MNLNDKEAAILLASAIALVGVIVISLAYLWS